ncbi:MAG: S53 family peptidase [Ktedonobacteraceae bacterium]
MRKITGLMLVLIAIVAVLGSTVAAFAKGTPGVDPFSVLKAHPYFILEGKPALSPNVVMGFTPSQFRNAYGISSVPQNGSGITVAIIDACGNPHAQADLNKYDVTYGLPAITIKVVKPQGTTCSDPGGWGVETDLDIQMVHAVAPGAKIVLEAAKSASFSNLLNAAKNAYTKQGATVVSMSFGGGEFSGEKGAGGDGILSAGNKRGVSFTASSGDSGCGAQYPAASPFVTSLGGTSLVTKADGTYISESAWNGSGGGLSSFETRPSYQNGFNSQGQRGIPDVAMVSDPNTGVVMYDSDVGGFVEVGGTSVAAPMWAGVIALANSGRSSTMKNADIELYNVASNSTKYASDYHDITGGSSGGNCIAGTGYDLVTGLGTPAANNLVPGLIAAP